MNTILPLALAAAVSVMVIPLVWRFAPRLGLLDMPAERKVHTVPVPRVGGWGIVIGTLLPLLVTFQLDPLLQSFVLGSLTLFAFGTWDDVRQLGHWSKFSGQLIAAGLVVYYGDLYVARLPFVEGELSPAIGRVFTMFAFVGTINALNHSDGLDGLAAGEALLSLIAFAVLGNMADSPLVLGIALALIGGILGFLRYNSHPAQVFMGDAGSQMLGFSLAFLAVYITQTGYTAISAALPLLLLGLPLADIIVVLFKRARGRMNWFRATRNHVHHRLLDLGFNHFESVVLIYLFQALLIVMALALRYESDLIVTGSYALFVGALFSCLSLAERQGWRAHQHSWVGAAKLGALLRRQSDDEGLPRRLMLLIAAAIPAVVLTGAVSAATIPHDFAVTAAILVAILVVELLRTRLAGSIVVRACIYTTLIFSSYLMVHFPGAAPGWVKALTTTAIAVLAVAVATYIRYWSRKFSATPTDFLISLGVLALLVFGSISLDARATVEFVTYAVVLMYGCEIVARFAQRQVLHAGVLSTLVIIVVRGAL